MGDHEDLEVKKKVLRDQIPYLRQSLGDPSRYVPYLVQGDVLNSHEGSFIRSKATSKEKLETFLQFLIKDRNEVSTFDVFVAALEDLKIQSQVARRLQRTLAYEKEAALNADAAVALDNGSQYMRDVVDDQFSKDETTEAIDAAAALNHLINKATHVATSNDSATTANSHHPSATQDTTTTTTTTTTATNTTTTTVQPSLTCSPESTAKQSSTSSSPCVPVVKPTTTALMRSIGTATSNDLVCPFADPQWNVTVQSQKFDHNGGTLHLHEHDIDIVIPQRAISVGDVVEVQAAAILSGPYKMPSKYDAISVTVWVGAGYRFNKLIKISIPHCAVINGPQDISGLVVLTTTSSSGEKFTVNTNSKRLSQHIEHPNCYCYEVNNPCCDYYTDYQCGSICLARRSFQLTTVSIMVFCWKPDNCQSADKVSVEFCFCYNLKQSVKAIKNAYKTRNSTKPQMLQWNVEIDSRRLQRICISHSIIQPDTPAVTRKCSKEIDIGDLDFQHSQSHASEREMSSVHPSSLLVCFTRRQQSFVINFKITVESDGATSGLQRAISFSLTLDKLTSPDDRQYDNLPYNSDRTTTAARAANQSQEGHVKETPDSTVGTVATIPNHMRDNLSSSAAAVASGSIFMNKVYMINTGHNISLANSFEEPKCAIEFDVKNNYLQAYATDIASLDLNTIQMHMMNYGLLTREQQDYFTNSSDTPCAKGRRLCGIILSFNESCVEKFLQCLAETCDYEPHRQLLEKIRKHNSTV